MTRLGIFSISLGLLLWISAPRGECAGSQSPAPEFREVYDLIRAHLAGAAESNLNRTAVQALVSALAPEVSLVGGTVQTNRPKDIALVDKGSLFEGDIARLRLSRVAEGTAAALRRSYARLTATNKVKGLVLDLRFAGGDDYAAVAPVAELFLGSEKPLLDWGNGIVRSKAQDEAITVPVAVLINRKTSGAAEALAAVLRETGAGLLLGSRTAGQAMITQEFPLENGQRLRIATAPVRLADGATLGREGVKADVAVEVSLQDERAYLADAFKVVPGASSSGGASLVLTNQANGTNRARRVRFNEAELVRERKEGFSPDSAPDDAAEAPPEGPMVQDPVLARALDVLKGLAVVRQSRY